MIPLRNLGRFYRKTLRQPGYAFLVFEKRLKAHLGYLWGGGRSSYPEAITLFLTHRCNLRCKMCGQWGESGVTRKMAPDLIKEELSFPELKKVIDEVNAFKPNITLFGGEPLLHPGCIRLIEYIKKKNMHCLMITNGSLLAEFAEKLVGAGLDELNVSLDGGRDLHDEIRGMPGVFEKITDGIKEVNRIKKEKGRKKPLINLQCTIVKYNYQHLQQLLQVAGDIGADSLTYHNLIFLEKDLLEKQKEYDRRLQCSSADWEGFLSEPEIDPEVLHAKMEEILAKRYSFSVDFYPNFSYKTLVEYYRNPAYMPSGYPGRCLSPWMVAYIFPNGEMRPCLNFSYSYGNIKGSSFTDIWNGNPALKYRRILKESKIFPVCVRCTELYRY